MESRDSAPEADRLWEMTATTCPEDVAAEALV